MIKHKFKLITITLFYFIFSNLFSYESKIVVKVDNKVITNFDLKNKIVTTLVLSNEEINQENIDKTKPLVLKSLIDLKVKESEIKKYKINVTTVEINNNLNLLSNNDLTNFKKKFDLNNLDYESYISDLKTELGWRKLIYFLYNKKVKIDEAEINLQLEKTLKENQTDNFEYRLTELLVSYESQADRDNKINSINQEIREKGFDNVLKSYNKLVSDNYGDLGWINSQSLSSNILDAIKDLKINEVSKPLILSNDLLFLRVKDKRKIKSQNENIEEVKKQILKVKENQRFSLYSTSHLSKLKNLATIEYK